MTPHISKHITEASRKKKPILIHKANKATKLTKTTNSQFRHLPTDTQKTLSSPRTSHNIPSNRPSNPRQLTLYSYYYYTILHIIILCLLHL